MKLSDKSSNQQLAEQYIRESQLNNVGGMESFCGGARDFSAWLDNKAAAEKSVATTDHAANLAVAIEAYIVVAARISAGGVEAAEWDSASDTWRAVKTAAHEYRKHFPLKTSGDSNG